MTFKSSPQWIAFRDQRNAARTRGIEWRFTFEEWWSVWRRSGKFHLRGRYRDNYVMARFGDVGPYAVGNVKIIRSGDNVAECHIGITPTHQQTKKWRKQHSETMKAWAKSPEARESLRERGRRGALARWG